ncbi:MAG: hypothetical protein LBH74_08440 [Nitrososphaerota archaeon]|jgi:hypothetical protein|nr:hypothetical protein [Nitrososphaerota archaeon]
MDSKMEVSLNDFYKLKRGMTMKEVDELVGEPSRLMITGKYLPKYYVKDDKDNLFVDISLDFGGVDDTLISVKLTKELLQLQNK